MNLDESTSLTAYLDGTLDPELRLRVESALRSDPGLAEHLRGLAAVRELVAGLPRPSPAVDIAALVLARLEREARRPRLARVVRLRCIDGGRASPAARALAVLSAAAVLVAAASLAIVTTHALRNGRTRHAAPDVVARRGDHTRPDEPRGNEAAPVVRGLPNDRPAGPDAELALADDPRLAPAPAERHGDLEQQKVRRILDSPHLRKVFVVADVIGGQASRQVGRLLETTPRKFSTYICITVDPEITVDARHPGGASVFAVVLDDQELDRFRETLRGEFPGKIEESDPRPEDLTLLADVGQANVFPGTPVADLIVPDAPPLSLRSEPKTPLIPVKPGPGSRKLPGDPGGPSLAGLDTELIAALDGFASKPSAPVSTTERPSADASAAPKAGPRPRRPTSVVLVWVSRPPGDGRSAP